MKWGFVMVRWLVVAMAAAAVLAGCGGEDEPEAEESTALESAYDECTSLGEPSASETVDTLKDYMTLGDDGRSLSVESEEEGEVNAILSYTAALCVLKEIDVPDSTIALMEGTNSLMGRQTDSWDEFEMTWSYHPDNGVRAVIEEAG